MGLDLDRAECERLLSEGSVGRLAVNAGDGRSPPVIRPVNYVFDVSSQSIVFRTAPGSKLTALLRAGDASFETDGVDPELRQGWSVIVQGPVEEISSPPEIEHLEQLALEPWAPGEKPYWLRIRATVVSGRRTA